MEGLRGETSTFRENICLSVWELSLSAYGVGSLAFSPSLATPPTIICRLSAALEISVFVIIITDCASVLSKKAPPPTHTHTHSRLEC